MNKLSIFFFFLGLGAWGLGLGALKSIAQDVKITEQREKTKPHFDFGGNISFGYGGIYNTGSIQKYYDQQMSDSLEKSISTKWGTVWSLSGVVALVINDRLHFNSGIGFQSQKNNIELKHNEDFSNGNFKDILSTARISVASIQIPLTAKIRFMTGSKNPFEGNVHPYIRTGLSYDIRLSKTLNLNETITEYNGTPDYKTTRNSFSKPVKLDGYGNSTLNYIIGVGSDMILLVYDKTTFVMEISFSSQFGKDELWTENLPPPNGNNPTNSEIFAQQEAQSRKFNDWKSSNIRVSLGLLF